MTTMRDLEREVERLQARVAELEKHHRFDKDFEYQRDRAVKAEAEVAALQNERERLRDMLDTHGRHGDDCDKGGRWKGWKPGDPNPQCQCGLDAALAPLEGSREPE